MENRSATGSYVETVVGGERVRAFVPAPLLGAMPLDLGRHVEILDRANQALGQLSSLASLLPDYRLFLYVYVRKEALLSSQIEGTQSSLSDLLMYEAAQARGAQMVDVRDVSNYVAALEHGLERLSGGFPLSLRLVREIHALLLRDGRGGDKEPGEFRRSQNWIGGTRPGNASFVPPPIDRLDACLDDLEKFLHAEEPRLPILVRAALAHVQFETIHPFLDGNGRLGRMLVTLLLCARGALREPLLYLSLHFKLHRTQYYELLQRVRTEGVWDEWIDFFLEGVVSVSKQAVDAAGRIRDLFESDRDRIKTLGRPASSALRLHEHLQRRPFTTIQQAAADLRLSAPTVATAAKNLEKLGIIKEISGRDWRRLFAYSRYFEIINADSEPLPP